MFAPRVNIVVVRIGEGWDWNWIERDGGVERPTNTLSKSGTDARLSTVILLANYPVVRRDRVGASSAIPWFAASARPSGLGAGAAARGAGSEWRAEAAEVLAGRHRLLSLVVPSPRGGCGRHGRRPAHTERSLGENGVFLVAASGVRDRPRGAGQRQPLLVKIGGCGGGFIRIDVGISTSYEVRHVEKSENDDGDV